MPVNIDPSVNPEKIPHLTFVPQIALPSVFNDALSYTEVLGKVVAVVNKSIDNVNTVAENMTEQLIQTITGAKLPEYFDIIHNNSEMIDLSNWTIDDPAGLYTAVGEGKLCILNANVAFDDNGNAIPYPYHYEKFILAEVTETLTQESITRSCCFYNMNNYNTIRLVVFNLTKTSGNVTSECVTFNERNLMTDEYTAAFRSLVKDKLMVYKGDVAFPETSGNYIELSSQGVLYDLAPLFCVTDGSHIIAKDVCPCIVIDKKTGFIGEMRYGGNNNPWVRIYGTGTRICTDAFSAITTLTSGVNDNSQNIELLTNALNELAQAVDGIDDNVDGLLDDSVKYTSQIKTVGEKEVARINIDAVGKDNAEINNSITVQNRNDNGFVKMSVYKSSGDDILDFDRNNNGKPILKNIANPTDEYDVANKKYVDENSGSDAVKYTAQNRDNVEKSIARSNIGALEKDEPLAYGNLSIINQEDNAVITAEPEIDSGATVVNLDCSIGDRPRIGNVAMPVNDTDVATKQYVDEHSDTDSVKFVSQSLTNPQKSVARTNIDAASRLNAELTYPVTLIGVGVNGGYNLALRMGVETAEFISGNEIILVPVIRFYKEGDDSKIILSGIANPIDQNDAANKVYVDNIVGGCVKYSAFQPLSDLQKEQARDNIGAAAYLNTNVYNHVQINPKDEPACVTLISTGDGNTSIVYTNTDFKIISNYEAYPGQDYTETLQKVSVGDPTQPSHAATKRYVDIASNIITLKCDGETGFWTIYYEGSEQRWLYEQLLAKLNSGARVRVEYNITEQSDTVTTTCVWWGTSVIGIGAMMNTEDGMVMLNLASDKTFTPTEIIPQ